MPKIPCRWRRALRIGRISHVPRGSGMPDEPLPLIVHLIHSLNGGGTERTLVHLLCAFDTRRFRHSVVTLRDCGELAAALPNHVACRPLNAGIRNRLVGMRLAQWLRRQRAALVHARGIGCWVDATVAGMLAPNARVVLGFHGSEHGPELEGWQRGRARWGLRAGARFTSVSQAGKRWLASEAGIPPERVDVLPNGVDLEQFQRGSEEARARIRQTWRIPTEAMVVGTVGSLTAVKDHAALLRALAALKMPGRNLHLLVVGDGPMRSFLTKQAGTIGLEGCVTFTGWSADVLSMLHAMDLYVCCSLMEGLNNAMLEAMAAGLPIIATDVGDNAMVVRHGREGLIVPTSSDAALAGAIATVCDSSELRRRWGGAAAERVHDFDFRHTLDAYQDYYQAVLGGALDAFRQRRVGRVVAVPAASCPNRGLSLGRPGESGSGASIFPTVR